MNGELVTFVWERLLVDFVPRMGWVLYHSVWQGLVVAGLLKLALHSLSGSSRNDSQLRYSIAVLALFAIPILGLVTLLGINYGVSRYEETSETIGAMIDGFLGAISLPESVPVLHDFRALILQCLPIISAVWLVGFLIIASRLVRGWVFVCRLVREAQVIEDASWQGRVDRLCDAMCVRRSVRLLKSKSINTPAVVGWFHPVILWPESAIAGLSTQGISALVAHELAHIRRSDYFVNIVQSVIDAIYFYHPGAWWISRQIRLEREHCADELAIQNLESSSTGTRISYGQTLLKLEESRPSQVFTIRATGGFLLPRIRRITGQKEPAASRPRLVASLLAIFAVAWLQSSLAAAKRPISNRDQRNSVVEPSTTDPATTGDSQNTSDVVITEAIAHAIQNRLAARRIDGDALRSIRAAMWNAIREDKPLVLQHVYAILSDHGYDRNILHSPAEDLGSVPVSNEPPRVTDEIAEAIIARLSKHRIDTAALCAVRDGMWEAIRAGNPLSLVDVYRILADHGYDSEILHTPPR